MKKVLSLFAAVAFSAMVMAEESESESTILNSVKDFSHWSISANIGMSQFDGDVHQNYNQLLSASHVLWAIGVDVEYTINPVWGIIAEFQYVPYMGKTSKYSFKGNSFDPSVQLSINVLNLFSPYRRYWRWAWYVNGGVGMSFYNVKHEPVSGGDTEVALKDGRGILFPIGTNVEYNINKYIAVGLNGYYRLHNKDNFEGEEYVKGTMNDATWHIGATVRLKFDFDKSKKGGHMRNLSQMEYRNLKSEAADLTQIREEIDSLKKRVAELEDTVRNDIDPRLYNLDATTPDEDGDGVPDFRDREPNTPAGSVVNFWGQSVATSSSSCCDEIQNLVNRMNEEIDYGMSVYFDFNKWNVSALAKRNIKRVAERMKANPDYTVEIRGYCDFPGSDDANKKVSKMRVDAIKSELVKSGIAENRISVNASGTQEYPPRADYQSRRCDFVFSK